VVSGHLFRKNLLPLLICLRIAFRCVSDGVELGSAISDSELTQWHASSRSTDRGITASDSILSLSFAY